MKNIITVFSLLAVINTTAHAKMVMCFDTTAKLAIEVVKKHLGGEAAPAEINVYNIDVNDGGAYVSGQTGRFYNVDYSTRIATGVAYVGDFQQGRIKKNFKVIVHTKAGTCETLGYSSRIALGFQVDE